MPGTSSAPTPKSLQGTSNMPTVSARGTMAAANESLLQAAADGNVAGLQQAIAAGPAPESREEEHKAAKKVAEGRQLWSLESPPLPVSSDPQLQLHVLLQGHPQPPLTVLAFLPQLCAHSLGANVNYANPFGPVQASADHEFWRLWLPQRPRVSCILAVPKGQSLLKSSGSQNTQFDTPRPLFQQEVSSEARTLHERVGRTHSCGLAQSSQLL